MSASKRRQAIAAPVRAWGTSPVPPTSAAGAALCRHSVGPAGLNDSRAEVPRPDGRGYFLSALRA
ncbi:MAG TPA: hypothetical protein VNO70_07885 [Blastocatellia bacterium]|nr:hypothetical protein [Blastocatellia bacterium]